MISVALFSLFLKKVQREQLFLPFPLQTAGFPATNCNEITHISHFRCRRAVSQAFSGSGHWLMAPA